MAGNVRLGIIVPSVSTVVENWYPKIVPDGVSVHFARMLIADGSSPEESIAMDREDGVHAIYQIASCRPRAIAYGCTVSWRLLRLAGIKTPIHGFGVLVQEN